MDKDKPRQWTNKKTGTKVTLKQLANSCKKEFTREETTEILELLLSKVNKEDHDSCKEAVKIFLGLDIR